MIPGEEIKTDGQGEVIGLFLQEEIPRGLSFADTLAAIREQGGLVYLPHPFDRLHAIPDPATLHRHLAEIDVFEVYNARLLFETYNDEALRFARKYNLTMGAGSDAHVLPGVGTGALRMRAFRGPEEFLSRSAQRADPAPPEVPRLPPEPQVGGPGQGKGPLAENKDRACLWPCRPTRSTRSTCKRRSPRSTLSRTRSPRAAASARVPVLGSGHPLADVMLLKYSPQAVRAARGRRVLRPCRPAHAQVAAAASRRPAGRLRHELPQVRGRRTTHERLPGSHASSTSCSPSSSSSWASRRSSS